jgi:hypothetical protein
VTEDRSPRITLEILSTYEPNRGIMATITQGEDLCTLSGDPAWVSRQLALHVQTWARAQSQDTQRRNNKMMKTAANLKDLLDTIGTTYAAAGHILVDDGATRAIYTAAAAATLAEAWMENLQTVPQDDEDGYERGQAYTRACSMVKPLRDEDVPADVLEALREESGLRGRLTFGW